MKILLTGATGYVGKRLLPALVAGGHEIVCCVRDKNRFNPPIPFSEAIQVVEVDFLKEQTLHTIPEDIEGAYYLIHSMSERSDYESLEMTSAKNFRKAMSATRVRHVIYLTGMVNEDELSRHLASRKAVENELKKGKYYFTALRAGIIIGSGSASFEIIRDLVEKLPVMIAPKWVKTRCQPIGIGDVIRFLTGTLFHPDTFGQNFDIGGPDILSYHDMLMEYARVRNLKRSILIVPVMTPGLSSFWLYFVTSTSYKLAVALVDSMKVEVVSRNDDLHRLLGIDPLNYESALKRAFTKIESNEIISSWKDSLVSGRLTSALSDFIHVPTHGCLTDTRRASVVNRAATIRRIWGIGGKTGWYYASWLWGIRGFMDQVAGGVGLRRGRTHPEELRVGDTVDFWRVLFANREEGRLLLFAEMKLPGEAWLEFRIEDDVLLQTATFRPRGVWGRLYWYLLYPFHGAIFGGMVARLAK